MNPRRQNLLLGALLIAIGSLSLLDGAGVPVLGHLWKVWPLVLVAAGAYRILLRRAGAATRRSSPERLLLILVTLAGVATTFESREQPGAPSWNPPPPPPPGLPHLPSLPPADLREIKTFKVPVDPKATVTLDVAGADLSVHPGGEGEFEAIVSGSPLAARDEQIHFTHEDDRIELSFARGSATRSVQFRVEVRVSPESRLVLRTGGGQVEVHGIVVTSLDGSDCLATLDSLPGPFEARVKNGDLVAHDIAGRALVVAVNGNVTLSTIAGGAEVHVTSGNVDLREIGGATVVTGSDGILSVHEVAGSLEVAAERMHLDLSDVASDVTVELEEGSLKGRDLNGALRLTGRDAGATVNDVRGKIEITTTLRPVRVSDAPGAITIAVEDADATIKDCPGAVTVRALRGNARLEGASAARNARVVDGDVWMEEAGAGPVDVEAERGNVHLALGQGNPRLDLRAEPGRILSRLRRSLPVRNAGPVSTLGSALESGGVPVRAVVHDGFIRVRE